MYWLVPEGEDGTGSGSHSRLFSELIVICTVNSRCTKRSGPYLYSCLTLASGHRCWLHYRLFVIESPYSKMVKLLQQLELTANTTYHLGLNSALESVHQVRSSRSLSYRNPRLLVCYTCDHCSHVWCLNCTLPVYTWGHILSIVVVIYSLFYTVPVLLFQCYNQNRTTWWSHASM